MFDNVHARFISKYQYDSLGFELERLLLGGVSQTLPMTTSDVWSIARLAVLWSNDALATTIGAVLIVCSRSTSAVTSSSVTAMPGVVE